MYAQELFVEQRPEALFAFIAQYPLGAVITRQSTGTEIDHLPCSAYPHVGPSGTIRCHAALGNPIGKSLEAATEVVVVFQSPNAYISPSWMPARQRHGRAAPSWNYAAVHVYGHARIVRDGEWLKQQLRDLSGPQEEKRPVPWSLDEAPSDYIAQLLDYIVGIEITIDRLVGKRFVGQQRSPKDREGVIAGLLSENTDAANAIAAMMHAYAPRT